AGAAELFRPGRCDPALAMQVFLPVDVFLFFELLAIKDFAAYRLWQVCLREGADFLAEFALLRRDFKIHDDVCSTWNSNGQDGKCCFDVYRYVGQEPGGNVVDRVRNILKARNDV